MRSIVGTWKMVAAAACDRNGNPLPAPYGGKGMGRVVFNVEGDQVREVSFDGDRMMLRPPPRQTESGEESAS